MKKIPIGIDDFKKIRTENYYYIDKTKFIEEILNDGAQVKLFCRPRRFGKTLNMSTLKYFFDVKEGEENRKLFDNLYIKNSPLMNEQGKYPVVFISMKEIKGTTWEEMERSSKKVFSNLYEEYKYLRENLDERNLEIFDEIWKRKDADYSDSLNFLSNILEKHYNQKVIILIDEYDAPLISAYENNYYNEAITFFKGLYGAVLKSNSNLKMGVLTGVIRVAQAGIFSDLNNLKVNTILNEAYDEYFGLTEKEIENSLKDYEMEYKLEEVKSWYDGYRFGNAEVYNPWSILNYIDEKKLKPYWVNTSGNVLIRDLLVASNATVFDDLEKMIKGEEILVFLNQEIVLGNNLSPNSLWELMLFSGYLTIKERSIDSSTYYVRIPNKEIQSFFKALFADIAFKGSNNIGEMKRALQSKDISRIIMVLEKLVLNAMSFYDNNKEAQDSYVRLCLNNHSRSKELLDYWKNPYQMLLGGFLYGLDDFYRMIPNPEAGDGRADIILKPRIKNWAGYIFELKRAKTKNMKKEAKEAYEQIEKKRYDALLKSEGVEDIIKIGLVFNGKKVETYF